MRRGEGGVLNTPRLGHQKIDSEVLCQTGLKDFPKSRVLLVFEGQDETLDSFTVPCARLADFPIHWSSGASHIAIKGINNNEQQMKSTSQYR